MPSAAAIAGKPRPARSHARGRAGSGFVFESLEPRRLWSESAGQALAPAPAIGPASTVTAAAPVVVDRRLFYNDSVFDGHDPEAWFNDLQGVATDKLPLLPGQIASFVNVSGYAKGINGVLVRFTVGPTAIDYTRDLVFRAGLGGNPLDWRFAPAPDTAILIPPGEGDDPVLHTLLLAWQQPVALNEWVQVRIRANANTGLAADDVFYFGSLVGDITDPPAFGNFQVNGTDYTVTRLSLLRQVQLPTELQAPLPTDPPDVDRDGRVTIADLLLVRRNMAGSLSALVAPGPAIPQLKVLTSTQPLVAQSARAAFLAPSIQTRMAAAAVSRALIGPTLRLVNGLVDLGCSAGT